MELEKRPAIALAHTKNLRGSSLFSRPGMQGQRAYPVETSRLVETTQSRDGHAKGGECDLGNSGKAWLSLSGRLPVGHCHALCFFKHFIVT